MNNRKFCVGDRVRYALREGGSVAIVTAVGVRYRANGQICQDGVRLNFPTRKVENLQRGLFGNAIYSPEVLRHDDDNANEKVAWSDCVWQPNSIRAC